MRLPDYMITVGERAFGVLQGWVTTRLGRAYTLYEDYFDYAQSTPSGRPSHASVAERRADWSSTMVAVPAMQRPNLGPGQRSRFKHACGSGYNVRCNVARRCHAGDVLQASADGRAHGAVTRPFAAASSSEGGD